MNLTDEEKSSVSGEVKELVALKPSFEVGSSMPLSFGARNAADLEDPDDLLTEDDKVKPDADSLKARKFEFTHIS